MQDDEKTTGCQITSDSHKSLLARDSINWNKNNPVLQKIFKRHSIVFTQSSPF